MGRGNRPRRGLGILSALTLVPFLFGSLFLEGSGGSGGSGDGGSGGGGEDGDGSGGSGAGGSGSGGSGGSGSGWEGPFDEGRARATIEAQRRSEQEAKDRAKALETELTETRKKLDEFENAGKSELQKLTDRLTALETDKGRLEAEREERDRTIQELRTRRDFDPVATKAKAVDNEAVWAVLPLDQVEYDSDGKPKNLEQLVEKLKERHPRLFESGKPAGSADGGARPTTTDDAGIGPARLRKAYSGSGSR